MLSNPMFLEMLAKERRQTFEEEANISRLLKSAKAANQRNLFFSVEKFADLLISLVENLKIKYCLKATITSNSSVCVSKDACGC
jgi:hypothetical protein